MTFSNQFLARTTSLSRPTAWVVCLTVTASPQITTTMVPRSEELIPNLLQRLPVTVAAVHERQAHQRLQYRDE